MSLKKWLTNGMFSSKGVDFPITFATIKGSYFDGDSGTGLVVASSDFSQQQLISSDISFVDIFITPLNLYAVSGNQLIIFTRSGGIIKSITAMTNATFTPNSIKSVTASATHIFIADASGLLVATIAGDVWERRSQFSSVNRIVFYNNRLYATSNNLGQIQYSDDLGVTWSSGSGSSSGSLTDLRIYHETLYATNFSDDKMYQSTNLDAALVLIPNTPSTVAKQVLRTRRGSLISIGNGIFQSLDDVNWTGVLPAADLEFSTITSTGIYAASDNLSGSQGIRFSTTLNNGNILSWSGISIPGLNNAVKTVVGDDRDYIRFSSDILYLNGSFLSSEAPSFQFECDAINRARLSLDSNNNLISGVDSSVNEKSFSASGAAPIWVSPNYFSWVTNSIVTAAAYPEINNVFAGGGYIIISLEFTNTDFQVIEKNWRIDINNANFAKLVFNISGGTFEWRAPEVLSSSTRETFAFSFDSSIPSVPAKFHRLNTLPVDCSFVGTLGSVADDTTNNLIIGEGTFGTFNGKLFSITFGNTLISEYLIQKMLLKAAST